MIYCTKCGFKNSDDDKYCINCGDPLDLSSEKDWEIHLEEGGTEFDGSVKRGCFGFSRVDIIIGLFIGIFIILAGISRLVSGIIWQWIWSLFIIVIGLLILAASLSRIWRR